MKEKDIHELIEQQNPERKQRIWEKIQKRISDLESTINDCEEEGLKKNNQTNQSKEKLAK